MLSCHMRSADLLLLTYLASQSVRRQQLMETSPVITIGKALVGLGCYFVVLLIKSMI